MSDLPSIEWTKVKDAATAASLTFGVAWAFWTWGFSEWLRRRKLLPALDGMAEAEMIGSLGNKVVTTIKFNWRNKGDMSVYIDTKRSNFMIYELNDTKYSGIIGGDSLKSDFITPILQAFPLAESDFYFMEPKTESPIYISAVLDPGKIYMAQIQLRVDGHHHSPELLWNRSVVFLASGTESKPRAEPAFVIRTWSSSIS